jgi:hypothetical protein
MAAGHRTRSWCAVVGVVAACSLPAKAAGADASGQACGPPLKPMQRIELMFARNVRGHPGVGDAAWARFVAREITPRFPDGLTVIDASGQWRNPSTGKVTHEPTRLVIIVTADDATAGSGVAAIIAAYKTRFHQESVGVVSSAVCAAF